MQASDAHTNRNAKVYRGKVSADHWPAGVPSTYVAIKVLHPGVDVLINNDVKIMRIVANILHLLPGAEWLSFPDEVKTFADMMQDQLDLRNEANYLRKFINNFANRSSISFPEPVEDMVRKDVLVESFSEAVPVSKFLSDGPTVFDHELADDGLMAFLVGFAEGWVIAFLSNSQIR